MSAAPAPITSSKAREIVAASVAHLARITLPQGRFIYAHQLDDTSATTEGYNLLRHCGTLWFMARAARHSNPAPELIDAIRRATGFIGRKLQPTPWARPNAPSLALVGKDMVKLGGLGLGLLALAEVRALPALQGHVPASMPLGLDETIARMRRYTLDEIDGDDFRHKRSFPDGAVQTFRSDYYTGEAILGLLRAGETDAELARVTTAILRRGYGFAQQSHWMAYAAAEAVEQGVIPEALGSAYLTGLMEAIVGDTLYRFRRQSTPVACRAEALTRVLMLTRRIPGILSRDLIQRMQVSAIENLQLQLDWYKDGQFWKGDDDRTVQIDYIQHNATAFLHWAELED